MTNIATIEDILENILGLVLGAAPGQYSLATSGSGGGQQGSGKSGINNAFRPSTVQGPGFWLIAQSSTLTYTGGSWSPEYDKDAVTFYTWANRAGLLATKDIVRVTVWVGLTNRDNDQGQKSNTSDPGAVVNASANPVIQLGNAWELIQREIPAVLGPGTSFDPDTIAAVRQVLATLVQHASDISTGLRADTTKVDNKTADFRGSAESAWYQRVLNADHFLSDLKDQQATWDTQLGYMETVARNFVDAVVKANNAWSQKEPKGAWPHPYRLIAHMFNEGKLDQNLNAQSGLNGPESRSWDIGSNYAETNGQGVSYGMIFRVPAWLGGFSIDPFNVEHWSRVDRALRETWARTAIQTWAGVQPAAQALIYTMTGARNKLILADPPPVPPPPMPNNPLANGPIDPYANMGDPFANWGNPFANWGNPFANFGNPFANFGDPFANFGDPFANLGGGGANNPFANFGGDGNPFPNGPDQVFATSTNPFANTNEALGDPFGPGGAGANNPFANAPLDPATLFMPPTGQFANGPAGGFGSDNPFAGVGDPGGQQFFASNNPFGGAGSGPQTLGELTPDQLHQLQSAGLLDDVPLTPQQAAFLSQNGLGVPGGAEPTLGQLSPEQLDALRQAGLLDQTPITAAERNALGLSDPGQLLPLGPTAGVDTSPFPTTVNGLDVNGPGADSGGGLQLGDVTQPGATDHPNVPGFLAGTGGLSSVPGISGSPGALSPGGLGLTVGSGAGGGLGGVGGGVGGGLGGAGGVGVTTGGLGSVGSGGAGAAGGGSPASGAAAETPFGGMPFMPPMMGGAGGGGRPERERSRNTWLKEDEKVWGTDPDCAPAVVGRRGRGTRGDEDDRDYGTTPEERTSGYEERRTSRGR
ncbi:hypothetical protein [Dactylosporangium sp. CA-092794]|uniref:hypothetical protein n=1 Tax=Dactylosporangium sp. CA-092794 TaxID=3239929 RepID=UPI003D8CCC74